MPTENKFLEAIKEIRKSEKKVNFDQTVDLLINLKSFDVRREAFNLFIQTPHKVKDKKIAGFLEGESKLIHSIKKEGFGKYKEKKEIKRLIRDYDFFVANAKLMPSVATSFGRVLGPSGKMPSPQLGILPNEEDATIQKLIDKINSTVRIRVKEPSIKIAIGKESMKDEELMENALKVYNKVLEKLPRKNENIRNIMIKFTMDKPVKVGI
jgi:large subunit ribosomal protein L1